MLIGYYETYQLLDFCSVKAVTFGLKVFAGH